MEKVKLIEELFQKKLGIMIKNSRTVKNRSVDDCAKVLGIEPKVFEQFETGQQTPTLPQLEILAFYLDVPIQLYFTSQLQEQRQVFDDSEELQKFLTVRRKSIATRLKSQREQKELSIAQMIANTTLDEKQYREMEEGQQPISLTNLQAFMYPLNCSLKEFYAEKGKIGEKYRQTRTQKALENVPNELQQFMMNPSNEPYLRLAMHLSSLSAERLRSIAEGLLEITY